MFCLLGGVFYWRFLFFPFLLFCVTLLSLISRFSLLSVYRVLLGNFDVKTAMEKAPSRLPIWGHLYFLSVSSCMVQVLNHTTSHSAVSRRGLLAFSNFIFIHPSFSVHQPLCLSTSLLRLYDALARSRLVTCSVSPAHACLPRLTVQFPSKRHSGDSLHIIRGESLNRPYPPFPWPASLHKKPRLHVLHAPVPVYYFLGCLVSVSLGV